MKAGGSYSIVFGKKLQSLACEALGLELKSAYAKAKEISHPNQGMTAVEKIFNANAQGIITIKPCTRALMLELR